MIPEPLDRDTVWYLETYDLQMEDWTGILPYREWSSEAAALEDYRNHREHLPGGAVRLVREDRRRTVIIRKGRVGGKRVRTSP